MRDYCVREGLLFDYYNRFQLIPSLVIEKDSIDGVDILDGAMTMAERRSGTTGA
jgi:hypothetical protein